jgi:hypothetical protein
MLRPHGQSMGQMVGHGGERQGVAVGQGPQEAVAHVARMGITGQTGHRGPLSRQLILQAPLPTLLHRGIRQIPKMGSQPDPISQHQGRRGLQVPSHG